MRGWARRSGNETSIRSYGSMAFADTRKASCLEKPARVGWHQCPASVLDVTVMRVPEGSSNRSHRNHDHERSPRDYPPNRRLVNSRLAMAIKYRHAALLDRVPAKGSRRSPYLRPAPPPSMPWPFSKLASWRNLVPTMSTPHSRRSDPGIAPVNHQGNDLVLPFDDEGSLYSTMAASSLCAIGPRIIRDHCCIRLASTPCQCPSSCAPARHASPLLFDRTVATGWKQQPHEPYLHPHHRPLWRGRTLILASILLSAFNLRTAVTSLTPLLGALEGIFASVPR